MLDTTNISTEFDSSLVRLSPLVVRNTLDMTDDGVIEAAPELQFQVENVTGKNLVDLEVEVNYYDSESEFVGTDNDLRIKPVYPNDKHTFSLFIDPPKETQRAELNVSVRKTSLRDRLPLSIQLPFILVVLGVLYYLDFRN